LVSGYYLQHMRSAESLASLAHIVYYLQYAWQETEHHSVHILFWFIAINIIYLLTILNTLTVSILSVLLSALSLSLTWLLNSDCKRLETVLLVKDFQPLLEQAETVQAILFLLTECISYQSFLLPAKYYFRNSTETSRYHVVLFTQGYGVEEGNGILI